jgi:outer membrane murein-binding lipoprotein Lpp
MTHPRAVALVASLLTLGTLPACVSQGKYDAALQEVRSLKAENAALQSALAAVRSELTRAQQRSPAPTNNQRLSAMLSRATEEVTGQDGAWQIRYREVPMMVLTSEAANRMRIIAVVGDQNTLDEGRFRILMQANFETALDARYALFQGKLWSAYLHPLRTLTEAELTAALEQVANLVKTYGTTYSSGALQFRGPN